MAGPWEKYAPAGKPWEKYAKPAANTADGRTTAPGTTEEQASRIPEGMIYDERTGGYVDTARRAERGGKAPGAVANFISGAPFVGEFADEALGHISGAIEGRSPEIGQEVFRQSREQFAQENPKTAMGLKVAGGVIGSLPLALTGAGMVAGAAGKVGQIATAVGLGGATGAVEGAAQGYGAGETAEDRATGARRGAVVGGALGAALAPVASVLGMGAKEALRRVKGLDLRVIADEFGLSRKAARVVQAALRNDDLDAAQAALTQAGDTGMLADAGPSSAALLDAAMASGGQALRVGRDAVEGRAEQAGKALSGRLDEALGVPLGRREAQRAIAQRTAGARKAAYDQAYGQAIDYAGAGQEVEAVLQRVPTGTMQRAISEANEAMQEAGVKNRQIMAQIADDGSVSFREMPNVQQLDEIRKALSQIARDETDAVTGKISAGGLRARRLAGDLNEAIKNAAPAYKRAVRIGGDKIAEENAFNMGVDVFKRGVTLEDVNDAMRGASQQARAQAVAGLRRGIEDTLSNVRRAISDPNVDAREAMQLAKDMSSRANHAKLNALLGGKSKEVLSALDEALPALELRAAVAGNSKTAIRQSIQDQVATETAPSLLRRVAGKAGNPLEAAKEITSAVVRTNDQAMTEAQKQIYAEIAQALTNQRGADAQRALSVVRRAINGQPVNDAQAQMIGKAAGALLFSGGYQGLERTLNN